MKYLDPIIITGAARSGTSLTANIIQHAGAFGGNVMTSPHAENPTGFYENENLRAIIKKYLAAHGFDAMGQKTLAGPELPRWNIREQIISTMAEQGLQPGQIWYFKAAKAVLMYGTFIESFPAAKWVLVRRGVDSIVESCMRTSFMGLRSTKAEWYEWAAHHAMMFDALKKGCNNVREVWYEKLMDGKHGEIENVINWIGLRYDKEYISNIIINK